MKRRAFKLVVFLLLGAIVNVAVAWAISITDSHKEETSDSNELTKGEWILMIVTSTIPRGGEEFPCDEAEELFASHAPDLMSRAADLRGIQESRLGTATTMVLAPGQRLDTTYKGVRVARVGWPVHSLVSTMRIDRSVVNGGLEFEPVGAIEVPLAMKNLGLVPGRYMPLRPIWPGLAINTLFYAGILWLMFAAPFALRRRRRSKRGLCPACAYPVGESHVCTECGKPVVKQKAQT